ncbi:MAG: hypothetical protein KAY65_12940 [Planctomycetes bacterium]|nr:hypothetical protein [Planctomycetota bacterium]
MKRFVLSLAVLALVGQAQQYSGDLKPAWARSFEPPGVCSAVTAHNMRTLVQLYLYTKDNTYLRPIPAAIEWLENSNVGQNLWARLYEVGTNRPIYGDRMDGNKIHYDYDKLSLKERTSYAWQGEYGIGSTISYYRRCKTVGADAYQARQQKNALTASAETACKEGRAVCPKGYRGP